MALGFAALPDPRHEAATLRRLITVDHAGEHGAIAIYRAQLLVARRFYPDLAETLGHILAHERDHFRRLETLRRTHAARRCRVFHLWAVGGWLLGCATALLGRNGVRICTAAVEDTVNRHLDEQIAYVQSRAPDIAVELAAIQTEEREHQHFAEARLRRTGAWALLDLAIRGATEGVIRLSMRSRSGRAEGAACEIRGFEDLSDVAIVHAPAEAVVGKVKTD